MDQCTQGGFGTLEQAQYGKIGGTLLFGLQNAGGSTGCGRFKPDAEEDDFLIRVLHSDFQGLHGGIDRLDLRAQGAAA